MKHKHNIDSLIAALKDRNPRIRRNAAYVLGRKKDRRILPALITTVLNDKNQYVQEFALAGLSRHKIKDIRIIKSLLFVLRKSNYISSCLEDSLHYYHSDSFYQTLKIFRKLGKAGIKLFIRELKNNHWRIRALSASALVGEKDTSTIKPLIKALNHKSQETSALTLSRVSKNLSDNALQGISTIILAWCLIAALYQNVFAELTYQSEIKKFENWLLINRDPDTFLPHSHVGDERFENWAITYDSAVVTFAYIAAKRTADARKVLDFYIETPNLWRIGGIIEAVNPTNPVLGEDWSVRTGANLWLGLAGFHLFKATKEIKYLELAKKIADFAITLQNNDSKDYNFGGIRLGPLGSPNITGDQHLNYDANRMSFYEIFATEHNIDAYALFNLLYRQTKEPKYKGAREKALTWIREVAYNKEKHRFNRGYGKTLDMAVATDVHSWGISALGVDILDTLEPGLAERMLEFLEKNCLSEVTYAKPDGRIVKVKGVDFVDRKTAANLGREPLVSPEWTFQLINAYRRLELDFKQKGDSQKADKYRLKKEELIKSILDLAVESGSDALAYPYATQPDALIGHEYRTPAKDNLSTIGVSYAILALSGFDPLI